MVTCLPNPKSGRQECYQNTRLRRTNASNLQQIPPELCIRNPPAQKIPPSKKGAPKEEQIGKRTPNETHLPSEEGRGNYIASRLDEKSAKITDTENHTPKKRPLRRNTTRDTKNPYR